MLSKNAWPFGSANLCGAMDVRTIQVTVNFHSLRSVTARFGGITFSALVAAEFARHCFAHRIRLATSGS